MKIFSTEQIRQWDVYTIKNEGIDSLELMEQAYETFLEWFTKSFPKKENPIYIICVNGNNGGDGLAIGRLLSQKSYQINILLLEFSDKKSNENLHTQHTIQKKTGVKAIGRIDQTNEINLAFIKKKAKKINKDLRGFLDLV